MGSAGSYAQNDSFVAFDMNMAKEICDELPLDRIEGIWLYPQDNVTVLVLKSANKADGSALDSYTISVVKTSDARLYPGDVIGHLEATAKQNYFKLELATEKKNDLLLKPKSCEASLAEDGSSMIFKKEKSKLKSKLNFNFSRLLPGFWKIISTSVTTNPGLGGNEFSDVTGMVKIYPSYDGNGSSRRTVRYL